MLFGATKAQPAKVPTDKVIPLPTFDNTILLTNFVLHSMIVFDTPLDAKKLSTSLNTLVQREGWQKLSARLRKSPSGDLELRVPTTFTAERSPISHVHVQYDTSIAEHPVASQIPRPSAQPAIVADAAIFEPLYIGPDSPKKRDDYLYSDRSLLGLRVISFTDATIVILNWLHVACDALGQRLIVDAWLLTLQGREDEIKAPVALESDPLSVLGLQPSEPHALASVKLGLWRQIGWLLNNAYDMFIRPQTTQVLCIPRQFVDDLKAQALKELSEAQPEKRDHFLSDGDVLLAWMGRMAVSHYDPSSTRTVTMQQFFDQRKALEGWVLPSGQSYLSNAINPLVVVSTVQELLQKPISHAAQKSRQAIQTQTTRAQIDAYNKLVRESGSAKAPPLFGNTTMHQIMFSNWQKARFYDDDFVAAASSPTDHPVKPIYIQNVQTPSPMPELFLTTGQDSHGNYWINATKNTAYWDGIRKALERGDYMFEGR